MELNLKTKREKDGQKPIKPLVSIIVVTYNSAKFVLETLESTKTQSYPLIELIITDDCSSDMTLEICKEWLKKNETFFVRTSLLIAEKNTGISGNANRGLNAAKGEWLKFIAGDDIIKEDAIMKLMTFVRIHKMVEILDSKSEFFKVEEDENVTINVQSEGGDDFFSKRTTAQEQYDKLIRRNMIHSPGVFLKRELLNKIGGFIDKYKFIEDHPVWLKITKQGTRFYFFDEITVKYRVHENSVYGSPNPTKIYNDFYKKRRQFEKEMILPNLNLGERLTENYEYYFRLWFDELGLNKPRFLNRQLFRVFFYLNPKRVKRILRNVIK